MFPVRGWNRDPMEHDVGIGDDVKRILLIRNRLSHSNINDNEWDTLVIEVSDICSRFDQAIPGFYFYNHFADRLIVLLSYKIFRVNFNTDCVFTVTCHCKTIIEFTLSYLQFFGRNMMLFIFRFLSMLCFILFSIIYIHLEYNHFLFVYITCSIISSLLNYKILPNWCIHPKCMYTDSPRSSLISQMAVWIFYSLASEFVFVYNFSYILAYDKKIGDMSLVIFALLDIGRFIYFVVCIPKIYNEKHNKFCQNCWYEQIYYR